MTFLKKRVQTNLVNNKERVMNSLKWRHYQIGAILGIALDDLGNHTWKRSVQSGKSVREVTQNTLNLSSKEVSARVLDLKKKHNFSKLKRTSRQDILDYQKLIDNSFNDFNSSVGVKTTFISHESGCTSGGTSHDSFYLANGQMLDKNYTGQKVCPGVQVDFNGIPYLHSADVKTIFKISKDSQISLDLVKFHLKDLPLDQEIPFGDLSLNDNHVKIKAHSTKGMLLYSLKDGLTLNF